MSGVSHPTTEPAVHREVETKLDVDAAFVLPTLTGAAALRAVGIVAPSDPSTLILDAVYFDTEGLDLLRARRTLRRRSGGSDAGWHLKVPAQAGARNEIRLPPDAGGPDGDATGRAGDDAAGRAGDDAAGRAGDDAAGRAGDDAAGRRALAGAPQVPEALRRAVADVTGHDRLVPVARISTRRTVRLLLDEAGTVLLEVADDEVSGTRLLDGADATALCWRELEVEQVDGSAEQLSAVVDLLVSAGARPADPASKVGRVLGDPPTAPSEPDAGGGAAGTGSAPGGEHGGRGSGVQPSAGA